jgi:dUTP pyrophosphatase
MTAPVLKICPMPHFVKSGLALPAYQTPGSVGMDVRACLSETLILLPGERKAVPTGLRLQIPSGYEIQTRPRSGISLKTTLLMVNSPGTLDQDYTGETHILFGNFGLVPCMIRHGDRIAQWVMAPIIHPQIEIVDELPGTSRGGGGFGSTGVV